MVVVRAAIPEKDGCKVLTRMKAFVVDQGVVSTLEHVMRDRKGNPADLSAWLAVPASESGSSSGSSSAQPAGTVKLRLAEWMGVGIGTGENPLFDAWGDPVDPAKGVVSAELTPRMVEQAGIFEANWAVIDENGRPVVMDRAIVSVERSLFPSCGETLMGHLGPITLQEIRMLLMDSSRSENLLTDELEFSDDQILLAISRPIHYWNETPPPIRTFNTKTFPFRGAWMSGILAELYVMAAAYYRKNRLQHSAGGVSVDDKNKEREYMGEGARLKEEFMSWLYNKKVSINMKLMVGHSSSAYAFLGGW